MATMVRRAIASAPGKVILFGEHFVVYGKPSIAMAIDRRVYVAVEKYEGKGVFIESDLGYTGIFTGDVYKPLIGGLDGESILRPVYIAATKTLEYLSIDSGLKISISSEIPIASGLGSSASTFIATIAAAAYLFGYSLNYKELFNISLMAEEYVHGTPSGVDQTIAINGGLIEYSRFSGFEKIKSSVSIPLIIGNTGIPRSTGEMVARVRGFAEKNPSIMKTLLHNIEEIVSEAKGLLIKGDVEGLGFLMDRNQELLRIINVSHEKLEELILVAKRAGALGAKLTGAGGGGCMIALVTDRVRSSVAKAIEDAGGKSLSANISINGVEAQLYGNQS
jgi:mevalonate kinase